MMTEKIREQLFEIRNSAVVNMCEMAAVQRAAFDSVTRHFVVD